MSSDTLHSPDHIVGSPESCAGTIPPEQLLAARKAQANAVEARKKFEPTDKVVASNGKKTLSGYSSTEEMPEGFIRGENLLAPAMLEYAKNLDKDKKEEDRYKPVRSGGLDRGQPGKCVITHAEKQLAKYQEDQKKDEPIGVTEEQCGDCRKWFRAQARNTGKTLIIADPEYTRAYKPNGKVEIYDKNNNFVGKVEDHETPSANQKNYKSQIPW